MSDLRKLAKVYENWKANSKPCALATVIKVEGSAYRRPGARMLINSNCESVGSISGGCLEADVVLQSQEFVIGEGKSLRLIYNDATAEDVTFGVGAGCDGVVHIAIEPLYADDPFNPLERFSECVRLKSVGLLYTVIAFEELKEKAKLRRAFVNSEGSRFNEACEPSLQQMIESDASELLDGETAREPLTKTFVGQEQTFDCLVERFDAKKRLFVFGAGPDAAPVVSLAANLGWLVTVIDHRRHFLADERFLEAEGLVGIGIDDSLDDLPIDANSFALVMSHNLPSDQANLKKLIDSQCCYIGVLGPRRRTIKMLDDLRFQGMPISEARLAALHYPVGLDLGAETPEEIALSIMSEIEAVRKGHTALPLRDQDGPIHRTVKAPVVGG
jgi:xanthine/CO dehydrogenase XdhC/CoxF family maturation factor